nr:uncharacterized protein LOC112709595 [Arachis hypogaea]
MEVGSIDFPNAHSAMNSPFAKVIFRIDGITRIFFRPDFVTVMKSDDSSWELLKPEIFAAIMDFYSSDYFAKSITYNIKQIKKQLKQVKKYGLSVLEYISKIKTLTDSLAALGSPLSSEKYIDIILDGLNEDYEFNNC